ncbi:MAG: hypothetical protein IH607_00475 [Firmicutes bacterium]|nr:hypothetical protein [Bacillota bacterium]
MEKKLCPFNKFKPCVGEQCGASIQVEDGLHACSLQFIGHELYMLASAMIDGEVPQEAPHGDHH